MQHLSNALILFGHGARDPEWAEPIMRVRDKVQGLRPDMDVSLAYLEFMQPDLETAVAHLVGKGVGRIVVLPMFIAQGGHLRREVPEMIAVLQQRHPTLEIQLEPAVGLADSVLTAIAEHAANRMGG